MSNEHTITLEVEYRMYDMDGTPYASAEIALELILNLLRDNLAGDVDVTVTNYDESEYFVAGDTA